MNLFKLQDLKNLPAKGYAYLFAKPNKTLNFVDENGIETLIGRDVVNSSIPFTSFDFSTAPNGALPANDAFGNPFYLEQGGGNNVPIIDNGAVRTTGIGTGSAFYLGVKQNGTIYEMGCKVILGDGVMTLLITQGQGASIFTNPNWAMHLKISAFSATYEVYVANAGVRVKGCAYNLSKTAAHDIVVKFRESTAYLFINGICVLEATDSRISSFPRLQAIFEPFQNNGNVLYTRLISGYVKTAKQASSELVGVPFPPARQLEVNIPSTVTLTGTDQVLMGYSQINMTNISEAMVTVRLRINQTSPGDIILNVEGFTIGAVTTTNFAVISKSIKDDIVTATLLVKGIGGGNIRILIKGAFGTVPSTPTVPERMLVSVVPTAYYD